jgi:hypothetical protein
MYVTVEERIRTTTESQVRHKARKQGFALRKSRRRNPAALDYGDCYLVDPDSNTMVVGGDGHWALWEIGAWLDANWLDSAEAER